MRKGSRVKRFLWSGTAAALFAAVTWTNSSSLPASSRVSVKRSDISLTPTAMRSVTPLTSPHRGKSAVPTGQPLNRQDLARLDIGVREALAAHSSESQQIILQGPKEVSGQR